MELRERNKKTMKSTHKLFLGILLCILMIGTLLLGWKYAQRQYYVISVLLLLYTMLPFFLVFEKKRPGARELAVIAVMCAIAIVARTVFAWVPHFKPMMGIIMITAVALGPWAGFMTGAMAAFVSNFIFGQGTWTPWQMFAFGMGGFVVGALSCKWKCFEKPIPLALLGAGMVMVLVGPLLDTSSLFMMTNELSMEGAGMIYLSGLPVNGIHALATFVTLLLLTKPMLQKLNRVKKKYGFLS